MSQNTTQHPADALVDLRMQLMDLQARERLLCEAIIADRELRVGQAAHTIVREHSVNGVIMTEVESHTLPDLHEIREVLTNRVLVIDTETTGLWPARGDRVLSLGMLRAEYGWFTAIGVLHGGIRHERRMGLWDEYLQHFNPEGRQSSPEAARVHGISEAYLAKKLPFRERVDEVTHILCPYDTPRPVLCGHNVHFDIDFLNAELARCGYGPLDNPVIDTRLVSKILWPNEKGSLDALCERLGVDRGNRDDHHDALDDCHFVARCIPGLIAEIEKRLANV